MRSLRDYTAVVAWLHPLGAAASALVLGIASASAAATAPAPTRGVAERLGAIQAAVASTLPALDQAPGADVEPAWGYRWFNGPRRGWGNFRPRWNNFRPRWNNFWRNW